MKSHVFVSTAANCWYDTGEKLAFLLNWPWFQPIKVRYLAMYVTGHQVLWGVMLIKSGVLPAKLDLELGIRDFVLLVYILMSYS